MPILRRSSQHHGSATVALTLIVACGAPPEEATSTPTAVEVGKSTQKLLGGEAYKNCSVRDRLFLRDATTQGRVIASSPGFAACVRHTMATQDGIYGPYVKFPGDPSGTATDVIRRARSTNPVDITCGADLGTALGLAIPGRPDHSGFDEFSANSAFIDLFLDNGLDISDNFAETLWHEGMHTQGYLHKKLPGVFLEVVTPGYTDTIPLIVEHCIHAVSASSQDTCGHHGDLREIGSDYLPLAQAPTCDAGQEPLIDDYPEPSGCVCVRDPSIPPVTGVVDRTSPVLDRDDAGDEYGVAMASGDFDGDGHFDAAIGAPGEGVELLPFLRFPSTGAVYVYQSVGGNLGLLPTQKLTPGGLIAAGARLGTALAVADFDKDGYDDLAVGAPNYFGGGRVFLYRGSPDGLKPAGIFGRGGLGNDLLGGHFGAALVARRSVEIASNNGLVVGAPDELVGTIPSGAAYVFGGDRETLLKPLLRLTQDGVEANEAGDRFGAALAVGQIDSDLVDDIVVGAPGEGGSVGQAVVFLSEHGYIDSLPGKILLVPPDLGSLFNPTGQFGASLAVGRFLDPNFLSVAIGAPTGGFLAAGATYIYAGHPIIPEPAPQDRLRQFLSGPAFGSLFGTSLTTLDVGRQFNHLAVGAPGVEGLTTGQVAVFNGADGGLTPRETLTQPPMGIDEPGDRYGEAMVVLDLHRSNRSLLDTALLVGAPGEAPGADPKSGAAFLYGATTLRTSGEIGDPRYLAWQSLNQQD